MPAVRTRLAKSFDVVDLPADGTEAFLAEHGAGIKTVATFRGIAPDVMAALPDLKVISSFGVGYDSIDANEAARRGILVGHTPDVLNDEVADTTIMLWLAASKKLVQADAWARSGAWEREGNYPLTKSVRNRTVGILGLGRIGQTIASMAEMFDAKVIYHTRTEKDVAYTYYGDLVEMARDADVLVVITPGGAATQHLVNAEVLSALGSEGILINVARGSVVDEVALIAALEEGRLGGAGLDVFESEPHIPDALKAMDNVVLAPHIGSATVETRDAMGALVCENLEQWFSGGTIKACVPECQHLNG
ncbi:MAG: 2-hydroxyacid dehydrogenase [Silicimonas sp.]|nr:2-hydroxyacid dehydrogenase [Silicimonas sp.]